MTCTGAVQQIWSTMQPNDEVMFPLSSYRPDRERRQRNQQL